MSCYVTRKHGLSLTTFLNELRSGAQGAVRPELDQSFANCGHVDPDSPWQNKRPSGGADLVQLGHELSSTAKTGEGVLRSLPVLAATGQRATTTRVASSAIRSLRTSSSSGISGSHESARLIAGRGMPARHLAAQWLTVAARLPSGRHDMTRASILAAVVLFPGAGVCLAAASRFMPTACRARRSAA